MRRLAAFGLSLAMLTSAGIVAHASSSEQRDFDFYLSARGDTEQTSPQGKYNSNPTASVTFTLCENRSQYPIWYRLRSAVNDAPATEAYEVHGTGTQLPQYINGYGGYSTGYYLKIQTDSLSTDGAHVKGHWLP